MVRRLGHGPSFDHPCKTDGVLPGDGRNGVAVM